MKLPHKEFEEILSRMYPIKYLNTGISETFEEDKGELLCLSQKQNVTYGYKGVKITCIEHE